MQFNKTMKLKKEVIIKLSATNSNLLNIFRANLFYKPLLLSFPIFESTHDEAISSF